MASKALLGSAVPKATEQATKAAARQFAPPGMVPIMAIVVGALW